MAGGTIRTDVAVMGGRASHSMALFLRLTAYPASVRDPDLFRAVASRVNALDPPDTLAQNDGLVARALELAGDDARAPLGPTRDELLTLVG